MKYNLISVSNSSFEYICGVCNKYTKGYLVVKEEEKEYLISNKPFPPIEVTVCSEECFNLWLLRQ